MTNLADALERFNRKERNLLVRSVLGHRETPLKLSVEFRRAVTSKLGITDLEETDWWWATDYHMSWIAGALAVYLNDTPALTLGRPNPEFSKRRLVEGNQEDIDLLIAAGQHLIMIEAKAYGHWNNKQFASKLQRLDLLLAYYDEIKGLAAQTQFHLVLMSPHPPQRLREVLPARLSQRWPVIPHISFRLETSVLEVTRCSEDGKSSASGTQWRVLNRGAGSPEEA